MSSYKTKFEQLLENKGITLTSFDFDPSQEENTFMYCVRMIDDITTHYPFHDPNKPTVPEFYIRSQLAIKSSHAEVAEEISLFYFAISSLKGKRSECALMFQFLNENYGLEVFCFYLRVRKAIIQLLLGDEPKKLPNTEKLMMKTDQWVALASRVFADCYKPTNCVERITSRLMDKEYSDEITASQFLECCVYEYVEMKDRHIITDDKGNKNKTVLSLDKMLYRRASKLLNLPPRDNQPQAPPRNHKFQLPKNFNIMEYAKNIKEKAPSPKKTIQNPPFKTPEKKEPILKSNPNPMPKPSPISIQKPTVHYTSILDEELVYAISEEDPSSVRSTRFYSSEELSFTPSKSNYNLKQEVESLQEELEISEREKLRLKEALEELIEYSDTVSYEHDMLLIHNKKIKKLLSNVTDKLIRYDRSSIKDLDFNEVLNDPCRDFKPTGILQEQEDSSSFTNLLNGGEDEELNSSPPSNYRRAVDMPLMIDPTQNNKKKPINTPKFTDGTLSTFVEEAEVQAIDSFKGTHANMLSMDTGDHIKIYTQVDNWFFGRNDRTGAKGFFSSECVRKI